MESVNALIVALVTASNDAESLEPQEARRLIDTAVRHIKDLQLQQGIGDNDAATALERTAVDAERLAPDQLQRELRHAADMLRHLQPTVEPEPVLPAHQPDGGDGGNY
ncbi:hypothetical protein [Rhizobium sp. Leaf341]|uniref:hypothetical protein n=1 Tax=Rhizobium sp. Leaf341 TaxID=1736344 RepID=UPI0007126528|nr:hypothetical protein [Rhizobium sp. Leaf341]KQR72957.1 hypothetical protein ASG03_02065 [Rhizobium sp. Leaf341]